jgi:hypothetical protein
MAFTAEDGCYLQFMMASRLAATPTWNGQRILNEQQVQRIAQAVKNPKQLDKDLYRVFEFNNEDISKRREIYDGQHRKAVIAQAFANNPEMEDFQVMVMVKPCKDEAEAIAEFKRANSNIPIQYKSDPKMVANNYIQPLVEEFNRDPKKPMIKSAKTNRPYLGVEAIRDELIKRKIELWNVTPAEFVLRARQLNNEKLENLDLTLTNHRRAKDLGFALGIVDDFAWMN